MYAPFTIIEKVSNALDIPVIEITGITRVREIVTARQLYFFIARGHGLSLNVIARACNRDHTTVISGCNRISNMLETGDALTTAYLIQIATIHPEITMGINIPHRKQIIHINKPTYL